MIWCMSKIYFYKIGVVFVSGQVTTTHHHIIVLLIKCQIWN